MDWHSLKDMFSRFFQWLIGKPRGCVLDSVLEGKRVRDLMNRDVRTARPGMSVSQLMQLMMREHHLGFPVVNDEGDVVGMVSLFDVKDKPGDTPIAEVMRTEVPTVLDKAPASEALHVMTRDAVNRVVAEDGSGRMSGIITKTDLMNWIRGRGAGWPVVDLRS